MTTRVSDLQNLSSETDKLIDQLGERLRCMGQKLNLYVQRNGCSRALKQKAKLYLEGGAEGVRTDSAPR